MEQPGPRERIDVGDAPKHLSGRPAGATTARSHRLIIDDAGVARSLPDQRDGARIESVSFSILKGDEIGPGDFPGFPPEDKIYPGFIPREGDLAPHGFTRA
jgi:hypothetical protein